VPVYVRKWPFPDKIRPSTATNKCLSFPPYICKVPTRGMPCPSHSSGNVEFLIEGEKLTLTVGHIVLHKTLSLAESRGGGLRLGKPNVEYTQAYGACLPPPFAAVGIANMLDF
jgi:hypothetical protein